uniref:F-actin monooxygenase n=1 Tax=Bursaphelenchus xylophilus TaxID=6326 RepID=A0A1I7SW34_BURXY
MEDLFNIFLREWSLRSIQQAFYQLCVNRGADPTDYTNIYEKLKQADRFLEPSSKQRTLWTLLDKRRAQKEYQNQQVCRGMNVLVIGAGPCGLRAAIEAALLGCHVVVIESRDKFTRNNVLHLWQFVIHDLKALGAKVFMPKFCTGSIEHISIRKLQFILLKIALVLGVQFYDSVKFEDLVEPRDGKGWRAQFNPRDHLLADYEFDFVIAASGKNMCLPAFQQVVVRGKLAIGITANFVNRRTKEEDAVPEIQGVAYIYRQQFFDQLQAKTGVKLENIVYYKGDTHYFVMCGDKNNLVKKGVIKQDNDDIKQMLSKDNIDNELLCKYVMQVVDYVTDGKLSGVQFSLNARRQPDVALFDFTELCSADHSTRFVKYMQHPLVLTVVGDLLHEPFWPTGSGCARGFLGVLDTAWLIHEIGKAKEPVSKLLAEREGVYKLLGQTQPSNLSSSFHKYTIDPRERYLCFQRTQADVAHLMGTGDADEEKLDNLVMSVNRNKSGHVEFQRKASLFRFCYMGALSQKLKITNFRAGSWADGKSLAALISKYNQEFETARSVEPEGSINPASLFNETMTFVQDRLGIPKPCKTQAEWSSLTEKRRIEFLEILVDVLKADPFHSKLCMSPTLCQNYADDKATQSAKQAKVLRARQLPPIDPRDTVLNSDLLTPINDSNITVRKRSSGTKPKRPSVEPLNPELLFKVDRVVSGAPIRPPRPSMDGPSCLERRRMLIEERQKKLLPEKDTLNESLTSGTLAGVKSVSKFRAKFDSVPEDKNEPRPLKERKKAAPSPTSSSSSSLEDHPADPMNVRVTVRETLIEAPDVGSYRTRDEQKEVTFRETPSVISRPASVPIRNPSCNSHSKTVSPPSLAHQNSLNAVYNTVSQRRMRLCSLCQAEVYLAEQLLVDRVSVHKQCFRCAYCERALTVRNAVIDKSFQNEYGPRWYCAQHQALNPSDKLARLKRTATKQQSWSQSVAVVQPQSSGNHERPSFPTRAFLSSDSTDSSISEKSEVVVEEKNSSSHSTQTRPEIQMATQTTPKAENMPRARLRSPSPMNRSKYQFRGKEKSKAEQPGFLGQSEPHRQLTHVSREPYQRRLSDFDSPTQLINACKERTARRLAAISLKNDENKKGTKLSSTSSEDEDISNHNVYCDQTTVKCSDDDDEEEFEEEFIDAIDEELAVQAGTDEEESWIEFVDYLDRTLCSEPGSQSSLTTEVQAKEMVESFNRRSLLNHFVVENQKTPISRRSPAVPGTPFYTPRQHRAETVDFVTPPSQDESLVFQTPMTSFPKRRQDSEDNDLSYLKDRVKQNGTGFVDTKMNNNGTPQRPTRIRRGPRRATVAVDLKRESLTPDAIVNELRDGEDGDSGRISQISQKQNAKNEGQLKSRAVHIKPTNENLERVKKEIELVKERRQRERQRQLQGLQRRMHEVEVRMGDVKSVGAYLERSLATDPKNKWELEQWLIYVQQYQTLRNEERELYLKLKALRLQEDYNLLKNKLHDIQSGEVKHVKYGTEKELMERLLDILNEKDIVKAELADISRNNCNHQKSPAELIEESPDYKLFEPVFLHDISVKTIQV